MGVRGRLSIRRASVFTIAWISALRKRFLFVMLFRVVNTDVDVLIPISSSCSIHELSEGCLICVCLYPELEYDPEHAGYDGISSSSLPVGAEGTGGTMMNGPASQGFSGPPLRASKLALLMYVCSRLASHALILFL